VPEPLVAHVVGTIALLGAALLVIAAIAIAQQMNYVQTLNLMLAEAAESCARELVELVSVHTLGGSGVTYMVLTVPSSLAGQPYNLSIVNRGDNVIEVRAQLQLYKQVRVVVTPNFGRGPVYAVSGTVELDGLVLSDHVLLPTPQGWRAMLVAVNQGDAVLVGFATRLGPLERPSPPSFKLVDWAQQVSGLVGSTQAFTFAVWNRGGAGRVVVRVLNETGAVQGLAELTVGSGEVARGVIALKLPGSRGVYNWRVECWNPASSTLDDAQPLTVYALAPEIEVSSYDNIISGPPGSTQPVRVTVVNVGDANGTALIQLLEASASCTTPVPVGGNASCSLPAVLPSSPGRYNWTLRVATLETGGERRYNVSVYVQNPGAVLRILSYNSSVVGAVGQQVGLVVQVSNTGSSSENVEVRIESSSGTITSWSGSVGANSSATISLTAALPSQRGVYTWYVRAYRQGQSTPDDEKLMSVEARDLALARRTAFLYESFESRPSGWFSYGGSWSVVSGGWSGNALQGVDDDKGPGGAEGKGGKRYISVYYWGQSLWSYADPAGGISAVVKLHFGSGDSNVYRGFALLDSTLSKLYEVSVFRRGQRAQILLRKLEGGWIDIDMSNETRCGDGWYTLYLGFSQASTATLVGELYDSSGRRLAGVTRSIPASFQPAYLALMVDGRTGLFDDLVVAAGDPRYVVVRGLPQGWRAELYLGSTLVAAASADPSGTAVLPVAHYPILRGASLVLKDASGGQVLSRSFDVVGGDVYEFTSR